MSGQTNADHWDLTPYEVHRRPHETITDSTRIAVSPRSLLSEIMCPICLDILKSTMTTKECLHRFCQDCIVTALRNGNKECPTCRKKLASKRSLRPDPNFDALIAKICPSRKELDSEIAMATDLTRRHMQALKQTHRHQPIVIDSAQSEEPIPSTSGHHNDGHMIVATCVPDHHTVVSHDLRRSKTPIEFKLMPTHKMAAILEPLYLSSSISTTIGHLHQYLKEVYRDALVSHGNRDIHFDLFVGSPAVKDSSEQLNDPSMNLEQICNQYWKEGHQLELFFGVT